MNSNWRHRLYEWVGGATVLAAAIAVAWQLSTHRAAREEAISSLEVPEEALWIGDLWSQQNVRLTLPIRNRGRTTIVIAEFQTSCQCTEVSPKNAVIEPGGSVSVQLSVNVGVPPDQVTEDLRPFELEVRPVLRGTWDQPLVWRLRGRLREPIIGLPPHIALGVHDPAVASPLSRSFPVRLSLPERPLYVRADTPLRAELFREGGSGGATLVISLLDSVRPGRHRKSFYVSYGGPGESQSPQRQYAVAFSVVGEYYSNPEALIFAPVTEGTTTMRQVVVASRANQLFGCEVLNTDSWIRVSRVSRDEGAAQHLWNIQVTPDVSGTMVGQVVFGLAVKGADDCEQLEVPVRARGLTKGARP